MGSIFNYNGGCVLGMSGSQCVAIACDLRLGSNSFTTVSTNFTKIFKINDHIYVGLSGLATDIQSLYELLRYRVNLYQIRQETEMNIDCFSNMLSNILYSNRFSPYFVNPIVVGFKVSTQVDENGNKTNVYEPYLNAYDLIGAKCETNDFVVNGVSNEQLYGMCESMYIKDQDENGLFETVSQCLLSALDRDCLSGWGAEVYVLYSQNIIYKQIYEKDYPFKRYCIGDEYYGRVLSVNAKKIKLDILCDRKAYLNTSEYFSSIKLCKYINSIINIHDIIKIKIKYIQKIYQKIFVQIRKYSIPEILSSFQNEQSLVNSKIFYISNDYALVYIAPKIHAKLIINKQDKLDKYKIGDTIPVKVHSFNSEENELYVLDPYE
ncbi:20S proteasome subunit beta 3 [Plasmodium vinckei petteri]|uniref:20S proteasome subunit beta 3 n=1 Tax=Plasmodium vinckei petteri TaxID=138298 RepID=W7AG23_PLAVN|nr:20S proteasome subunit beta 3 [Plasmodium vinckei petteri]